MDLARSLPLLAGRCALAQSSQSQHKRLYVGVGRSNTSCPIAHGEKHHLFLGQDFATRSRAMPSLRPPLFGQHFETDSRDTVGPDFRALRQRLKACPFRNGSNRPKADLWLLVTPTMRRADRPISFLRTVGSCYSEDLWSFVAWQSSFSECSSPWTATSTT